MPARHYLVTFYCKEDFPLTTTKNRGHFSDHVLGRRVTASLSVIQRLDDRSTEPKNPDFWANGSTIPVCPENRTSDFSPKSP